MKEGGVVAIRIGRRNTKMRLALLLSLSATMAVACTEPADVDDHATVVRERLGALCSSFDFQTKLQIGGGDVRPVNCKNDGDEVTMRILAFEDEDHLARAWRDVPQEEEALDPGLAAPAALKIEEDSALVEVFDRSLLDETRRQLGP